jgi:beta-glucanase (GH16 family)
MTHNIALNNILASISKTVFLARAVGGCVAFMTFLFPGEMRAQNILSNPGFETGSLTNWTTFQSNNFVQADGVAHSGTSYYKVYGQFNTTTNFTGIYQDNPSASGDTYSADGWAYSSSSDAINGYDSIWIEVSFRDASENVLADYRSEVVTSNDIAGFGGFDTWFDLQIINQCSFTNSSAIILSPGTVINTVSNLVAPAGTAYVRYQVVFSQGADNANGSMYFDDLTLNQTSGAPPVPQWNIVWSDEFNGTSINKKNWTFETGNNNGWGNSELEYYTSSTNNAYVDGNGLLHIVALQQSMGGFNFTSARMKTQGLYNTPTYGRLQWRAALPVGVGMWPALWLLGSDYPSVSWPTCGEIDVVENNGAQPFWVQGSLHSGASASNEINFTKVYDYPGGDPNGTSTTNFHIYELDWSATSISWLVDGVTYETRSGGAPFNQPFFFIMNLAVGGNYLAVNGTNLTTAQINSDTVFPQQMLVDYVRVYEQTAPLQILAAQSDGNVVLSWPTNIVCHLQTQTNSLVSGNWSDLSDTTSPLVIAPDPNQTNVFYRLESP